MTSSLSERVSLQGVVNQGWQQVQQQVLKLVKDTIEGLLRAERDQRLAARRAAGEKVYRWGYTVRKCWQTLWGRLEQVRVPRLRGQEEIGLLEKYRRHSLEEVLFALTVGGLSQRKVVDWLRRFVGGAISPATLGGIRSSATNCLACWPTYVSRRAGDTACAPAIWPRVSFATCAST